MDRTDASGFSFLAEAIQGIVADEFGETRAVTICFLGAPKSARSCWAAGLPEAIESLWRQEYLGQTRSILVLGMASTLERVIPVSQSSKDLLLFQWPGAAYLPYGCTKDQLIAAARKAIQGAKAPLPPGLLPTAADVSRAVAEVRHWLEGRLKNTEGAMFSFERATRGEIELHPAYLDSVPAFSEEHADMLERLWALDDLALRIAPDTGGLAPLKAAVAEFEERWRAIETACAILRSGDIIRSSQFLADAAERYRSACEALSRAIASARSLE